MSLNLSRLGELSAAGKPYALATVVAAEPPTSARPGDKALITEEGQLEGWVGGSCAEPLVRREALRALADGLPRLVRIVPAADAAGAKRPGQLTVATTCPGGGSLEVFIDPQLPRPLLAVFGGSPAARLLVQMGALAGFRTCALHPGAHPEDFPGAHLVLSQLELAAAAPGPDSWAVVATMGHYDEEALAAALAHPQVIVSLVASRRRAQAVVEGLKRRGFHEEALARVRAPAGRVQGATQEEIAVLALAEVITLRLEARKRRPHPGVGGETEEQHLKTDPVCGMPVDPVSAPHRLELGGSTICFCSAECRERFQGEPQRFATPAPA